MFDDRLMMKIEFRILKDNIKKLNEKFLDTLIDFSNSDETENIEDNLKYLKDIFIEQLNEILNGFVTTYSETQEFPSSALNKLEKNVISEWSYLLLITKIKKTALK